MDRHHLFGLSNEAIHALNVAAPREAVNANSGPRPMVFGGSREPQGTAVGRAASMFLAITSRCPTRALLKNVTHILGISKSRPLRDVLKRKPGLREQFTH